MAGRMLNEAITRVAKKPEPFLWMREANWVKYSARNFHSYF
jgi:hypothetical protein